MVFDNFKYTQNAAKCEAALEAADAPIADKSLIYDKATQTIAIYTDFFKVTGTKDCAPTQCTLKQVGCTDAYTGTNLSIASDGTTINNKDLTA